MGLIICNHISPSPDNKSYERAEHDDEYDSSDDPENHHRRSSDSEDTSSSKSFLSILITKYSELESDLILTHMNSEYYIAKE